MTDQSLLTFLNQNAAGITFEETRSFVLDDMQRQGAAPTSAVRLDIEVIRNDDAVYEFQTSLTNDSDKPVALLSSVVLDIAGTYSSPPLVLRNGWQSISPAFFQDLGRRSYWRDRYDISKNPVSYRREYGYLPGALVSEWFTQLRSAECEITIGATTTRRFFSQIMVRRIGPHGFALRLTSQHDEITIQPHATIQGESFAIIIGPSGTLEHFGRLVRERMRLPVPKRQRLNGICCSYYTRYADRLSQAVIKRQVDFLSTHRDMLPVECIQIDDGYARWGDWLHGKKNFRVAELTRYVRERGFQAGLWVAPLCVQTTARDFDQLRAGLLKDKRGKPVRAVPLQVIREVLLGNRLCLDPTHPNYAPYIRRVLRELVGVWGVSLLKVDFMTGVACTVGTYYQKDTTRVDALRRALDLIRAETRGQCLLLSAIVPLAVMPGSADFVRITNDVTFPFVYNMPLLNKLVNRHMFRSLIETAHIREQLGTALWTNDFDCFVTDPISGLSEAQVAEAFRLLTSRHGIVMLGDTVTSMSKRAAELARSVLVHNQLPSVNEAAADEETAT